eukprot:s6195_g4.t1
MASEAGESFSLPSNVSELFGRDSVAPSPSVVPTENLQGIPGEEVLHRVSSHQPSSHVNFDHVVGAAWDSLQQTNAEPIWNTGFWKCIFGGDSLGEQLEQSFKRPVPPISGAEDSVTTADVSKKPRLPDAGVFKEPHFRTCVKSTDDVTWQE